MKPRMGKGDTVISIFDPATDGTVLEFGAETSEEYVDLKVLVKWKDGVTEWHWSEDLAITSYYVPGHGNY